MDTNIKLSTANVDVSNSVKMGLDSFIQNEIKPIYDENEALKKYIEELDSFCTIRIRSNEEDYEEEVIVRSKNINGVIDKIIENFEDEFFYHLIENIMEDFYEGCSFNVINGYKKYRKKALNTLNLVNFFKILNPLTKPYKQQKSDYKISKEFVEYFSWLASVERKCDAADLVGDYEKDVRQILKRYINMKGGYSDYDFKLIEKVY